MMLLPGLSHFSNSSGDVTEMFQRAFGLPVSKAQYTEWHDALYFSSKLKATKTLHWRIRVKCGVHA